MGAKVLTAIRRRELLALCAEDKQAKWVERIAAIKADEDMDPESRSLRLAELQAKAAPSDAALSGITVVPPDSDDWAKHAQAAREANAPES